MNHNAIDRAACEAARSVQPVWTGLETASTVANLQDNVLLHAGPAFASVDQISAPVLNSACVAAVYEELATDFDKAAAMIAAGEIELKPAQDHGIVTPLAAVVSASMPLHCVADAGDTRAVAYAPINGGARPAMRLGLRSMDVLNHIYWLNSIFADVLDSGLGTGIALVPLAAEGLSAGDDCHGRTPVAGAALNAVLAGQISGGIKDDDVVAFMAASPSLFLNLWMAATKCMMKNSAETTGSSFITAAGGNGRDVGIQVAGLPGRWFTAPASAPVGDFDVDLPKDRAMGAIGDSAIVDVFGLGAMSPSPPENLDDTLAINAASSLAEHPYFNALNRPLGSTARQYSSEGADLQISLGILDRLGLAGRLGGGLYRMPHLPFQNAVIALETDDDS